MRSRTGILIAFAIGGAATGAVAAFPAADFAYRRPAMQVALETAAALIAFVAALLVFGRFRQRGRLDDLFLFAALCVLSATNLLFSAIPAATAQTLFGSFTTWAPLIGRLIAALLLAVSAVVDPVPLKKPMRSVAIVGVGLLFAMVFVALSVAMLGDELPLGVVPGSEMAAELEESRVLEESPFFVAPLVAPLASIENLSTHPLLSGAQLVSMGLYAFAAVGFSARREQHDEFRGWLALGATFAALSALNYALFPSLFTDYVYTGDVFRLFFYLVLLIGAARVIAAFWRNLALVAVLEERGRVARDLHDGLAQELAFITRRARRGSQNVDDGGAMSQIAAAAQRALVDSRLVIAALTRPVDEPLDVALARTVEDAAARVGAVVEIELAQGVEVAPEVREAVIRIATEAVSNAARHAPGAKIRVELSEEPLRLRICDEGAGFDPDAVVPTTDSGFGLTSMRERAKALGAELRISSAPGEGTEVEMVLS